MTMHTHSLAQPKVLVRWFALSLLFLSAAWITPAQQRRPAANRTKPPTTAAPPTLETLLAADTYKIYGEVRGVGQLIRSNSVNELLEPVMKIAAPPKELGALVKWLNKHADAVMTSRMLVATWPTAKGVPSVLVAIEFASAEEAERFEPQLNDFLPRVLPTPSPTPSVTPETGGTPGPADKQKPTPPTPSYYLSRSGSLIFITSTRLTLKNLRPAGTKLLSEDTNFQTARTRFGSEQIFAYVDFNAIQKEEQENTKRLEEEGRKTRTELETAGVTKPATPEPSPVQATTVEKTELTPVPVPEVEVPQPESSPEQKQQPQPDPMSLAMGLFSNLFSSVPSKWPEGLGIAISLDNESIDAKVLMVSAPGEKSDAIPLLPILIPGPSINPEGASIFPADTELLVSVSLDWGQIYSHLSKPAGPTVIAANDEENRSPYAELENKLGIKIQQDLIPLLGSELAVAFPVTDSTPTEDGDKEKQKSSPKRKEPSPVVAIAIRDKERTKILLPKIIDAMGFKGASAFGQTEKRGDTEIVSFANAFAYAFVGNFLVVSPDAANVRRVVESYIKNETLSADTNFKNYTRWQPRQLQGQVYMSPALMESYKTWAKEPTALISEQTREFLTHLAFISQPVTYALSNDGLGSLHELHIPKNLLLMMVASISGETNPPPMLANERSALAAVNMIAAAEVEYRATKGRGSYGTLDQLIAEKDYLKNAAVQNSNYKIEVTVTGNHFEVSAVPTEYGKTGRMSYYTDETQVVRGGDLSGAPATVASKPFVQ